MEHRVYIAIGSNLGDRENHISAALSAIAELPDTRITGRSSLYETEPHGRARNWFLNAVVEIITGFEAKDLLKELLAIETAVGRRRGAKTKATKNQNVSREIDLDILLFDAVVMKTRKLTIPHRELTARRFVLLPLAELAPGLRHPVTEETISSLLVAAEDDKKVVIYRPLGAARR